MKILFIIFMTFSKDNTTTLHSWMRRPHDLKPCDISIFRSDIQPFWEDEANKNGGTWIVRIKRHYVSRTWEHMVLAMLGNFFCVYAHLVGL